MTAKHSNGFGSWDAWGTLGIASHDPQHRGSGCHGIADPKSLINAVDCEYEFLAACGRTRGGQKRQCCGIHHDWGQRRGGIQGSQFQLGAKPTACMPDCGLNGVESIVHAQSCA